MDQIKTLLSSALNPDANVRKQAEQTLLEIAKHPQTILSLPSLFNDPDPKVSKLSSIFFKNSIISLWPTPDFCVYKQSVFSNILDIFLCCDKFCVEDIKSVLEYILENSSIDEWKDILSKSQSYLDDNSKFFSSLIFYHLLLSNDMVISDTNFAETVYNHVISKFVNIFILCINNSDYLNAKLVMKILYNLEEGFYFDRYFISPNDLTVLFPLLCEVIKIPGSRSHHPPDSQNHLWSLKKWIMKYFMRINSKSFKECDSCIEIRTFVLDHQRYLYLHNLIIQEIKNEIQFFIKDDILYITNVYLDSYLKSMCEYLNTMMRSSSINRSVSMNTGDVQGNDSSNPIFNFYQSVFLNDISFLIFNLIVPLNVFNMNDEELYEDDPKTFLREKYFWYSEDLKRYSLVFFQDIISSIKKDQVMFCNVLNELVIMLNNYNTNPSKSNARVKYSIITLLGFIADRIKDNVTEIIITYIIPELSSQYNFLRSQACFSLQYFEDYRIDHNNIKIAFENILKNMQSQDMVLKTDAFLSITFFYNDPHIQNEVMQNIPFIIQNLLELQKINELEPINDVLDKLIETFPNEIRGYSTLMVNHFISQMYPHITSTDEDKIALHISFITTITQLVRCLSDTPEENENDKKEKVDHNTQQIKIQQRLKQRETAYQTYLSLFEIINLIFSQKLESLYAETLELLGVCVYSIQYVDDSMWTILKSINEIENEDKSCYIDDITFLLDNIISFGKKEDIIRNIEIFISFSELFCKPSDGYFYEDDYIQGASIIIALLVYVNRGLEEYIGKFIEQAMGFYDSFDKEDGGQAIVYCMEIIMHCFILDFGETYKIMKDSLKIEIFFNDMYANRELMCRVIDIKTVLIFIGILFRNQSNLINNLENEMNGIDQSDRMYPLKIAGINLSRNILQNTSNNDVGEMLKKIRVLNYERINRILIENIEKLPKALKRREKYKNDEEASDEEEYQFEETVCNESPLDDFNIKQYLIDTFRNVNVLGERMLVRMTDEQKEILMKFLN